jgi:hypothetical protein
MCAAAALLSLCCDSSILVVSWLSAWSAREIAIEREREGDSSGSADAAGEATGCIVSPTPPLLPLPVALLLPLGFSSRPLMVTVGVCWQESGVGAGGAAEWE